jgi:RNA polymerase sigma factor (sigma-70 family)
MLLVDAGYRDRFNRCVNLVRLGPMFVPMQNRARSGREEEYEENGRKRQTRVHTCEPRRGSAGFAHPTRRIPRDLAKDRECDFFQTCGARGNYALPPAGEIREDLFHCWGYGQPARIFQKIGRDSARRCSELATGRVRPVGGPEWHWTPPRSVPTIIDMRTSGLLATRRSLVDRLENWDDRKRWQEFFDTYWKLIYSAARKSGLSDAEAQEVVQETVITVAKKVGTLHYDPAVGSFKGWLLHITRWRIVDQFRKREPGQNRRTRSQDDRQTATIERVPDRDAIDLDAVWEKEWQENLFAAAIARVKKKVDPKQFQIFDCYVRKEWPAQKVAAELRVNVGQVYLARHRVSALLKKEIKALERHSG